LHRYGALIVLERWGALVASFGPHLAETRSAALVETAAERTEAAENILLAVNALLDEADRYDGTTIEACRAAFDSAMSLFAAERADADEAAKLGRCFRRITRKAGVFSWRTWPRDKAVALGFTLPCRQSCDVPFGGEEMSR